MRKVRIACYYPWLYLRSGAERTILEVARRSRHEWTIYTNHYDRQGTYQEFESLNVVELGRVSVNRGYLSVARAALRILTQHIPMEQHDVLLNHSEGLGDLLLFANNRKPVICYCHLPLLVANDESVQQLYLNRNPHALPLLRVFAAAFRIVDRMAWKRYSHVFASGDTVRQMIVHAGLAEYDEVEILHPGVDCESIRPSETFERFFLAFSRLKWWKNIGLAIDAFKRVVLDSPDEGHFRLVVAGQVDEGSKGYYGELQSLAKGFPQIEFLPNPSSKSVRDLYERCYAVLNTTINEPWGIIPLEANAYGKPVIAANRGGTRETQADGVTGFLVEPTPQAFADRMRQLAGDEALARRMGSQARQNALKYDWRIHVQSIDAFLDQFLS